MSFRWKLIVTYLLVVIVSIIIIQLWADSTVRDFLVNYAAESLEKDAKILAGVVRVDDPSSFDGIRDLKGDASIRMTIWDLKKDSPVLSDSTTPLSVLQESSPEVEKALEQGEGQDIRFDPKTLEKTLYIAVKTADGGGLVRLSMSLEGAEGIVNDFRPAMLMVVLVLPLFGAVMVWIASRRLGSSVGRLEEASRKIAAGEYVETIPVSSGDEIGLLARRMEEMSFRLHKQLTLLEAERNNLTTILNSMTEGVMVTDSEGRIVSTNPAFSEIFASPVNPHGRLPLEVVRCVEIDMAINSVLSTRTENQEEIKFAGRALQAHFSPILTGGEVSGVVIVFHDVTEIRRLESLQKEFISNVSHELKTPLTSIQGYAETLLDDEQLKGFQRKFIDRIFSNAGRLSDMIAELFKLVSLERSLQKLDLIEVSFSQIETELRLDFDSLLAAKKINLVFENQSGTDTFKAGKGYINRVFHNLVENALKYTEEGQVTVSLHKEREGTRVEVEDTGIGIPSEDLERIFERFYRVDKDRSRGKGGSGIGLAIVRHIIGLHGGEVWAESRLGKGTRIIFTIPDFAG